MEVQELIQLMRLSGTDKVREYLERQHLILTDPEEHPIKVTRCRIFLQELEQMFRACKRSDITEAWPCFISIPTPDNSGTNTAAKVNSGSKEPSQDSSSDEPLRSA